MRRALATYAKTKHLRENLLSELKQSKHATPKAIYVGSEAAAQRLITELKPRLGSSSNLFEINPGLGFLTEKLLELNPPKLRLFELSNHYVPVIEDLSNRYPGKIEYKIEDFFKMWKFAFLDRLDAGDRVEKMFEGIQSKPWEEGHNLTIIGCLPELNFIKHLIMSMVFQNSLVVMGRPEFYFLILPSDYLSLEYSDKNTKSHKNVPVLFNILFDHQVIAKLPCDNFLPLRKNTETKTTKKSIPSENKYLYLTHISAKEKLPCSLENLPLLWYFCRHFLRSRENRIIPKLEEWIPDCGIWLITGQDPPGTSILTGPDENDEPLPHITIFTQFQDLTPGQKLTIFKKFISWPEFEQTAFREALENHMTKQISAYDDTTDKIEVIEVDDEHEQI